MKRAILVLMVVVFALVTVVPTFALSQSKSVIGPDIAVGPEYVVAPEIVIGPEIAIGPEIVIGPEYVVDPNDTIVLEDAIIAVLRQAAPSLTVRKAGGDQQN